MKILYAMTALPPSTGGAQTHLFEIAKRMGMNHSVQGVCHWTENRMDWLRGVTQNAPGDKTYQHESITIDQFNLTLDQRKHLAIWGWSYYLTMGTSVSKISDALLERMDKRVGPVDIIHAGRIGREFLAWAAYKLAKKRGVPFVFTPFHHPRWQGWLYRSYISLYQKADAVMALTRAEKAILAAMGVKKERIHVIGHAPVVSSHTPQLDYFGDGGPVVLFLGQKYKYKGLEQLIKAMPIVWKQKPDVRFAFIGPRTTFSKRCFAKIKDSRVIEVDRVSEQDKASALADCSVFCLPSRQESFGGVFAEAWFFKKTVIGGDIPAIADVIDHGKNGYLVDGLPEHLADFILELLADDAKREKFGENGRNKVCQQYSWEAIAKKQCNVYSELVRR